MVWQKLEVTPVVDDCSRLACYGEREVQGKVQMTEQTRHQLNGIIFLAKALALASE